jgi:hypothetical protein
MDDEPQKPEPKISLPIAIFIGIIMILCDCLELIPIAGDILDVVVGIPLDIYLFFSGINMTYALIEQGIELIPFAQELPLWTVMWIATVYAANNPKLKAVADIAGSFEGKGVGGAVGKLGTVEKSAEEARKVGQVAEQAEKVAEVSAAAEKGTEAVQKVGGTVEGAGGTAEGAKGAAEETTREKVRRKLRERMGEQPEGGLGEGEEEPTEEEIAAEMAKEEELNKALGEPPEPIEELKGKLLPKEVSTMSQGQQNEQEAEGIRSGKVIPFPKPPLPPESGSVNIDSAGAPGSPKGNNNVVDISTGIEKTANLKSQWERERGKQNDENISKAA